MMRFGNQFGIASYLLEMARLKGNTKTRVRKLYLPTRLLQIGGQEKLAHPTSRSIIHVALRVLRGFA
jgi:hypothetical protein